MAVTDDNLVIKNFMGVKITNPPYSDKIVAVNGQYHQSDEWLQPVLDKIEATEGVTVRYYYGTILSIVKYTKDEQGKDIRQIDAWGASKYDTIVTFLIKLASL